MSDMKNICNLDIASFKFEYYEKSGKFWGNVPFV